MPYQDRALGPLELSFVDDIQRRLRDYPMAGWVGMVEEHVQLPEPKATVIKPPPAFPYRPTNVRSY